MKLKFLEKIIFMILACSIVIGASAIFYKYAKRHAIINEIKRYESTSVQLYLPSTTILK